MTLSHEMTMTGSRIMMHFLHLECVWKILVWNWKTGELVRFRDLSSRGLLNLPQVLDLSSTDEIEFVKTGTQVTFLDEFRVAVIPDRSVAAELVVFNTLVPRDHPGYMRRLAFPLKFHDMCAYMYVDHDRDLGTPNKDDGLLPDPAQAVLVTSIWADPEIRILLVVRTQVLVEQLYSVHAGSPVPWDEWGRDAVTIEVQNDSSLASFTFVHGAQVMVARQFLVGGLSNYHIRTFDFSRGSLPLQGGADGTKRSLLLEDGVNLRLEPNGQWGHLMFKPLSDGSLMNFVSYPAYHFGSEVVG